MENFTLENDISVFCVTASSFPKGIMAAHEKLHSIVPFSKERRYFGISAPNQTGTIVYKAAAEELNEGEAKKLQLEPFTIKKGTYVSVLIKNYAKDLLSIDRSFKKLLQHPQIDPNGACVEWYVNEKDVQCMIRLETEK